MTDFSIPSFETYQYLRELQKERRNAARDQEDYAPTSSRPTLGPTMTATTPSTIENSTMPSTVNQHENCLIPEFFDGNRALGQWVRREQPYPHQSDGLTMVRQKDCLGIPPTPY